MRPIIVLLSLCLFFMSSVAQRKAENNFQRNQPTVENMPGDLPTSAPSGTDRDVHLKVNVYDADGKAPIELTRVVLRKNAKFVSQQATNSVGQARFIDIEPGKYVVQAWFVGYLTFVDSINVDRDHAIYEIMLQAKGNIAEGVEVDAQRELAVTSINLATGNQVFESETFHPSPAAQMTNLIQENVMGVARAPTGEVHIRGHHGEFTYYVDGIPVPLEMPNVTVCRTK